MHNLQATSKVSTDIHVEARHIESLLGGLSIVLARSLVLTPD